MPAEQAANWFGAPPPDLTLTARIKHGGADWLYSYLKSFYVDEARPLGVNNTVFPNVGMPHVMWDLQGIQEARYKYAVTHHGHVESSFDSEASAEAYIKEQGGENAEGYRIERLVDRLELVKPGKLTPEEYSNSVRDLVTFLAYISEPVKLERQRLGIWVVLFLIVFTVLAYFMKKEYWKDLH
jgi:ubiquinol-cytochrome c reductase cytochrome c1 subunit